MRGARNSIRHLKTRWHEQNQKDRHLDYIVGVLTFAYYIGIPVAWWILPRRVGLDHHAWPAAFAHEPSRRNGIPWAIKSYIKIFTWPAVLGYWIYEGKPDSPVLFGPKASEKLGKASHDIPYAERGFATKWTRGAGRSHKDPSERPATQRSSDGSPARKANGTSRQDDLANARRVIMALSSISDGTIQQARAAVKELHLASGSPTTPESYGTESLDYPNIGRRPWEWLEAVSVAAHEQEDHELVAMAFFFAYLWRNIITPKFQQIDLFEMILAPAPPEIRSAIAQTALKSLSYLPPDLVIVRNTTGVLLTRQLAEWAEWDLAGVERANLGPWLGR